LRALKGAHLAVLDLEELEQKELEALRANYERLAREAREAMRRGTPDTGSPEVLTELVGLAPEREGARPERSRGAEREPRGE
jgi:hypothetical protein